MTRRWAWTSANHAGAYRNSSTKTDSTDQDREPDLDTVREFLEDSLERAPIHEYQIALGMGDSYQEAHQDALDSIPDEIQLGDIGTTVSQDYHDTTAVALQYQADHRDTEDWIQAELDRFEDAYR
ncbi:MAG: hypothetical protein SVU32_01765 [Candidatus Nanohaloarchaea archaeon]|nr:hypothetical protein [Candidatus Nanohaloarchaea archaeon]